MSRPRSKTTAYSVKYNKIYRMGHRMSVPALGSMRRLQALVAIGYSMPELEPLTGISAKTLQHILRGSRKITYKTTARKIDAAYRQLCVQPKSGNRGATFQRNLAKKRGWYPPFAWDDIDDPTCRPRV